MWDVKYKTQDKVGLRIDGFTLTMWDVKGHRRSDMVPMAKFYLNYVGCKVQ